MQMVFDFHRSPVIGRVRAQLLDWFGGPPRIERREPMGQLIKSLISGRTRDAVSLKAYEHLVRRYRSLPRLLTASIDDLEQTIAAVTFAEAKAPQLRETVHLVGASHPNFDLSFLRDWPVADALTWLERLPGVGRKVAASTLNFSTLAMPAFVVDTHVLRVLGRLGAIGRKATTVDGYNQVMAAVPDWDATALADFHVLMKTLGQIICRAELPLCGYCPISSYCAFAKRRSLPDAD